MSGLLRKLVVLITWIIGAVLILIFTLSVVSRIPAVQNYAVNTVEKNIQGKTGTIISIDRLYFDWQADIVIEGIYAEDLQQDTLLFVREVHTRVSLPALINKELKVEFLRVEKIRSGIERKGSAGTFNFQFIIDSLSSTSAAKADNPSEAHWGLTVNYISFSDLNITYEDETSGIDMSAKWDQLVIEPEDVDIQNLQLSVNRILLSEPHITLHQYDPIYPPKNVDDTQDVEGDDPGKKPVVSLGDLVIDNAIVRIETNKTEIISSIPELAVTNVSVDLSGSKLDLEKILLRKSQTKFHSENVDSVESTTSPGGSGEMPWTIRLDQVHLANNDFQFGGKNTSPSFDPSRMSLKGISGDIRDILVSTPELKGTIEKLGFTENQRVSIEAKGKVALVDDKMLLENIRLQLNKTILQATGVIWPSSFNMSRGLYHNQLDFYGSIWTNDLFYFSPDIEKYAPPGTRLSISGNVEGNMDQAQIHAIDLRSRNTVLRLKGGLSNLKDQQYANFIIDTIYLSTSGEDLQFLLPDSLLPANIGIPEKVKMGLTAHGSMQDLKGQLALLTSKGNVRLHGEYSRGVNIPHYSLKSNFDTLFVGDILGQPDLTKITASLDITGSGNPVENGTLELDAIINQVEYKGYSYEDVSISADLRGQQMTGSIQVENEDFQGQVEGDLKNGDSLKDLQIEAEIVRADLQALNFSTDPLNVEGRMIADVTFDTLGRVNGHFGIRNIGIIKEDQRYDVDSLIINAVSKTDLVEVDIKSDLIRARLEGDIDIVKIPSTIQRHVEQYLSSPSTDFNENDTGRFSFRVELLKPHILTELIMPSLATFHLDPIMLSYDGPENKLSATVHVNGIKYEDLSIDSVALNLTSNDRQLSSDLSISNVVSGSLNVPGLNVSAHVEDQTLDFNVHIPEDTVNKLNISGRAFQEKGKYQVSLTPDDLVLNSQNWSIPPGNYITFGDTIGFHEITLTHQDQLVEIATGTQGSYMFSLENFLIENLDNLVRYDSSFFTGVGNGNAELYQDGTVSSDLRIHQLTFEGRDYGDLSIALEKKAAGVGIEALLDHPSWDVIIRGTLDPENNDGELNIDVESFDLATIEPIVEENLQDLSGKLSARLKISGPFDVPDIRGVVQFNNVLLKPVSLGTSFTVDDQLRFAGSEITFENFTIRDVNKNPAQLDGTVSFDDIENIQPDLGISTSQFLVLNTTPDINENLTSKIVIDANAKLRVIENSYDIDAEVKLVGGSNLQYTVTPSSTSIDRGDKRVIFIDPEATTDSVSFDSDPGKITSDIEGINIRANLSVNNQSQLSIVLDPDAGDRLDVRGDANLSFTMSRTGDLGLTGRYVVTNGSYKLNFYQFVKREFQIVEGSSLVWTGNIMDADLDITTRYTVETLPPIPSSAGRIPFYVNLMITSNVLDPELAFELSMPVENREKYGNVYARLLDINNQETELNKQVFSLIVLNSFSTSDNTASSGSVASNTARKSLSNFLSQQLNQLTGQIQGVDLTLDVQSYEFQEESGTQGRTDVELGLSKSLLDDRLIVKLSGNVNVEGEENKTQDISDYLGDVILEYKLTEDGTYRLQAFHTEEFDGLTQGELSKTGVGIILLKDYNTLTELFRKKKSR